MYAFHHVAAFLLMRNLVLVSQNFCLWPEAVQKEFTQKGIFENMHTNYRRAPMLHYNAT